jgi:methionyl-tRNA formyltransferase
LSAKIIFMGTPDFAVPSLKALIKNQYEVVAVVTQPDRPSGRGKRLTPPPVKVVAEAAGLKVMQPERLRNEAVVTELAALQPDLIMVAAFGQILRQNVLDLPSYGCLNVHASLLPRWRGASPVTAAIRAGDTETGITLMKMDIGLDTGPILAQRAIPIQPHHTGGTLTAELAELGASLLIETLPDWLAGRIQARPQDDALATLAPRLKKEEGEIDWSRPAVEIERQIRAFSPWPGTFTCHGSDQIKLLAAEVARLEPPAPAYQKPGTLFKLQREVYVTTGQGVIRLTSVQPAGRKAMPAEAMLNGQPNLQGAKLECMKSSAA